MSDADLYVGSSDLHEMSKGRLVKKSDTAALQIRCSSLKKETEDPAAVN